VLRPVNLIVDGLGLSPMRGNEATMERPSVDLLGKTPSLGCRYRCTTGRPVDLEIFDAGLDLVRTECEASTAPCVQIMMFSPSFISGRVGSSKPGRCCWCPGEMAYFPRFPLSSANLRLLPM